MWLKNPTQTTPTHHVFNYVGEKTAHVQLFMSPMTGCLTSKVEGAESLESKSDTSDVSIREGARRGGRRGSVGGRFGGPRVTHCLVKKDHVEHLE